MTTNEHFKVAYDNDYYTILGCGGDLEEWKNGYNDMIREHVDPDFDINQEDFFVFTGGELNKYSKLTGDNAYPEDLRCIAFSRKTCKNVGKLSIFKLRMEDKWFSDVVDNDRRREKEKK